MLIACRTPSCYTVAMDNEILSPVNDWIFKLLFGDERHKDMLISLLKAFLGLPDDEYELTFLDTHLKPENDDEKLGILDVKVKTKTGKILNIEIQVNPVEAIGPRLSFYKSKMIVGQIGEGEHYRVIKKVICVCITDYQLFPGAKEFINQFQFNNPKNGLCFEAMPEEIFTLELPKLPFQSDGTALWEWMQFLRSKSKEDFEMAAEKNPEIRKAVNTLYDLSADEKVRAEYEQRVKAWRDRQSALDGALDRGIEIGQEKSREAIATKDAEIATKDAEIATKDAEIATKDAEIATKDAEIATKDAEIAKMESALHKAAQSMKKAGESPSEIAEATGLSIGVISKL